jgi:hypothetical protein
LDQHSIISTRMPVVVGSGVVGVDGLTELGLLARGAGY